MRHLTEKVHPLRRSTFLVAVATIGAVGWLTGCTVGPNYVTPTVEVPDSMLSKNRSTSQIKTSLLRRHSSARHVRSSSKPERPTFRR